MKLPLKDALTTYQFVKDEQWHKKINLTRMLREPEAEIAVDEAVERLWKELDGNVVE